MWWLKHCLLNEASMTLLCSIMPDSPDDQSGGGSPPAGKPTVLNTDVGSEDDGAGADQGADRGAAAGGAGAAAGGEDDGAGADQGAAAGGEGDGERRADWRDREIARKHRQLQAERRKAQQLEDDLATARALLERNGAGGDGRDTGAATSAAAPAARATGTRSAPDEAAVQTAAQKLVAKQTYDRQCNETYEKGKKEYGAKFEDALKTLETLGGLGETPDAAIDTMAGILATDDPAKVLYELGNNPDNYHRVMELPPHKRQTELVKLGLPGPKKGAPKPSGAPEPPEALTRRAQTDTTALRDDLSDDEWYKRRAVQKRRRWEEKQRAMGHA